VRSSSFLRRLGKNADQLCPKEKGSQFGLIDQPRARPVT
jgi:hypothetical protein